MSEFKSVDAWAAYREDGTLIEARTDWGNVSHRTNALDIRPVTISTRAAWVKVTPETNFAGLVDEQLWLVLDGSEVVLGTVDAEYDEFHGFTRYSFYSPEKWGEASITVTHYMPAHVPQAPEGE